MGNTKQLNCWVRRYKIKLTGYFSHLDRCTVKIVRSTRKSRQHSVNRMDCQHISKWNVHTHTSTPNNTNRFIRLLDLSSHSLKTHNVHHSWKIASSWKQSLFLVLSCYEQNKKKNKKTEGGQSDKQMSGKTIHRKILCFRQKHELIECHFPMK